MAKEEMTETIKVKCGEQECKYNKDGVCSKIEITFIARQSIFVGELICRDAKARDEKSKTKRQSDIDYQEYKKDLATLSPSANF
jgi:hypothetical protein